MAEFSVESWEDLRVQDSLQRDASVPFTLWETKHGPRLGLLGTEICSFRGPAIHIVTILLPTYSVM